MLHTLRRLLSFLRRNRLDDELQEEIRLHLELRQRSLMDDGLSREEAEHQARRQFGNVTAIRERARDQWGSPAAAAFVQDLTFGARLMTRSPGLSAVVVLTIALGAGVNAALFMLLNNLLLRAPDLPHSDALVWLDDGTPMISPSYPDYVDYRDRTSAFSDLAVYAITTVGARQRGEAQPVTIRAVLASGNYFSVLQTGTALGRSFGPADDLPPLGTATVVLSDAYWARRFNRDPGVLGQTIELNFKPFTIAGVLPPGFSGARPPNGYPYVPDVWVPMWCQPLLEPGDQRLVQRGTRFGMQAIGRLRDGVVVAEARAQIGAVAAALDAEYPGQRRVRTPWVSRVTDLDTRAFLGEQGIVIAALGTVSLFVLLIACANVAGLLLARAASRRREIAVRLSLGAGRARVVRQFLVEGLLLSAVGTLLGCIAAGWVLQSALSLGGTAPLSWSFAPDGRMMAFAVFLAVVAAIGTGLMPALQASKTALLPALTRAEGVRVGRLRTVLVGTEVAASLVLLLVTALLLRGVVRAHALDPRMPVDRLLALDVDARLHGYEGARLDAALRDIRREVEALPGVTSTALMNPTPFSGSQIGTTIRRAEMPDAPGVRVLLADVSASFVETAGLQLVHGRWFDQRASEEIVINQTLASRLWPSGEPLGAEVSFGDFNRSAQIVVGIVRDTPYVSLRQQSDPFLFRHGTGGSILIRTAGPAAAVARAASGAAARVDPRFVVTARPLTDGLAEEFQTGRLMVSAAAGLGLLALLVALAGVGATAAQSVAQRTQEIGVRMALGARRRDAVAFIVRRVLTPVAIGSIAGLVIAALASRVVASMLYGLSPLDPIAFAGTVVFLIAAAAVAAWLPARRAATIDPVLALRSE